MTGSRRATSAASALAIGANVLFSTGIYLLGYVGSPNVAVPLQVMWGLLILGGLIIRLRTVLQTGLMEGALEAAARAEQPDETEMGFCVRCEMPLLPGSAFCSACGISMRARAKAPAMATAAAPTSASDAPPPQPDEEQTPLPADEPDVEEEK